MGLPNNNNDVKQFIKEISETALLMTDEEDFFYWLEKTYIHGMSFSVYDGWSFLMSTGALLPLRVSKDTLVIVISDDHFRSNIRFTVIPSSRRENIARLDASCITNLAEVEQAFRDVWSEILRQFKLYESSISQKQSGPVSAEHVSVPLKPEEPKTPERGSSIDVWFDYYHAMKNAKYKMTFMILANESGYSNNTFKAEHGRYKIARGIT